MLCCPCPKGVPDERESVGVAVEWISSKAYPGLCKQWTPSQLTPRAAMSTSLSSQQYYQMIQPKNYIRNGNMQECIKCHQPNAWTNASEQTHYMDGEKWTIQWEFLEGKVQIPKYVEDDVLLKTELSDADLARKTKSLRFFGAFKLRQIASRRT